MTQAMYFAGRRSDLLGLAASKAVTATISTPMNPYVSKGMTSLVQRYLVSHVRHVQRQTYTTAEV
jgi:hypothetical protein